MSSRHLNLCKREPVVDKTSAQVIAVPPRAPHYSYQDWLNTNRERIRYSENQQAAADRIIAESEKLIEEAFEVTQTNKLETDHQLDVKIKDIDFLKSQLEMQKKEMDLELEAMLTYKERILDSQTALGSKSKEICKKCIILREGRLGTDLCVDEVEVELAREMQILEGVEVMYVRLLEQVQEQIRRLRAMNYTISRDLFEKERVIDVDRENTQLNEFSLGLSVYQGTAPLNPADITQEEWAAASQHNIDVAHKELVAGRPLRAYVDTILKQIIEDLWTQYDLVNAAFRRRIKEHKEAKAKLENQHFEIVRQANEMSMTVTKLEKALAEKEPFMALAHTRLGNRCQRAGIELCKDEVETYLVNEVGEIKFSVMKLQQMLSEASASLRYLLRTQMQLEEDINIKTNSIKIDEVECMTIRQNMDYHTY